MKDALPFPVRRTASPKLLHRLPRKLRLIKIIRRWFRNSKIAPGREWGMGLQCAEGQERAIV